MNKFVESELGPLLNIVIDYRGKTPKKLKGDWIASGIPALSAKNIKQGKIVNPEAIRYVGKDLYARWMKEEVKKGDILMTSEAPLGEMFYVKNNAKLLLSQRLFALRTNDNKLDSRFLFYYFSSKIGNHELLSRATGTTVGGIRQTALVKVMIKYPESIISQKQISSVLSAYDDLIENNEKRIKALDEMAQLLYTEWFVKFKFPGHEKIKMVDSGTEYGKFPKGWDVKKLSKVANIVRGCSYSSKEIDDFVGGYYIVNLKSFNRGGGFRFDGAKYYSGSINSNQSLKTGDVVVAVTDMTNDRAVIARPARVPDIDGKITFSADVVKINSDVLPNSFIYQLLSSYRFTETTKQKANGANVLHLKPAAILEFVTLIPDEKLLKEFDILCEPVTHEIDKLLKQNDNLSKIRDLLIPQLITGRRELKDLDEKVSDKKEAFRDAIIFSYYVNMASTPTFYPTHIRAVKNIYFADRFVGIDPTKKYTEQRFGPYAPKSTYAGGEKIALGKKYVQRIKGGFMPGEKISEIKKYTYQELGAVDKVLLFLKFKKDDELELLATIDFIIYKKLQSNEKSTANSVLDYIQSSNVWKEKIDRLQLTLEKVNGAISILRELAKNGLSYPTNS